MSNILDKPTLVMKFGGASLASIDHIQSAAEIILKRAKSFPYVVVVVSAMGQMTDQLIELAKSVNSTPPQREYDMLISIGERVSMALLAMAIAKYNRNAISLTGSQAGIITTTSHIEAKIIDIRPARVIEALEQGNIVIVAGFQGVSVNKDITTLGRGGSDTTAVALGAALTANLVEFYKDVPGIFSEDPKKNSLAFPLKKLSYEKALQLAERGDKILHKRALELAFKNKIRLHILSFMQEYTESAGTHIYEESESVEKICVFEEKSSCIEVKTSL